VQRQCPIRAGARVPVGVRDTRISANQQRTFVVANPYFHVYHRELRTAEFARSYLSVPAKPAANADCIQIAPTAVGVKVLVSLYFQCHELTTHALNELTDAIKHCIAVNSDESQPGCAPFCDNKVQLLIHSPRAAREVPTIRRVSPASLQIPRASITSPS